MIQQLLEIAVRVLFGPFPWEWSTVGIVLTADGIFWLAILFLCARGWSRIPHRLRLLVIVLPVAAILGSLVITSGNYGTMQRLRMQAEILMVPIAAAGFYRRGQPESAMHPGGTYIGNTQDIDKETSLVRR